MIRIFVALSLILSVSIPAHANSPASQSIGVAAKPIIRGLIKAFPEFKEHLGGFSYEVSLSELICNFSINSRGKMTSSCVGTSSAGVTFERSVPSTLLLHLLNTFHPKLDYQSEPGTTYFTIEKLNCSVIEPRSTPDNPSVAEYSCEVGK